jgi:hypothetical protein
MVQLNATKGTTAQLPVIWNCYMVAPTGSNAVNLDLVEEAVARAFAQSPYLKIK